VPEQKPTKSNKLHALSLYFTHEEIVSIKSNDRSILV